MSVCRTLGSPSGGGRIQNVVQLVDGVGHVVRQCYARVRSSVERIAGVDRQNRRGANFLGHLEILVQAHAVGRPVTPSRVVVPRSILHRAHGVGPLEAGRVGIALQVVAAWHAEDGRMQGRQFLHEIDAQMIGLTFVRWRVNIRRTEPDGRTVGAWNCLSK